MYLYTRTWLYIALLNTKYKITKPYTNYQPQQADALRMFGWLILMIHELYALGVTVKMG